MPSVVSFTAKPMLGRVARAVARRVAVAPVAARCVSAAARRGAAPALRLSSPAAARVPLWASFRTAAALGEQAEARTEQDRSNQLFVGNLPFTVDAAQLGGLFTDYGVQDTKIVYDQQTGRSKGIAFITFTDADQASKAQGALNGAELGGRNIRVESRTPPGERRPYETREPRAPRERRPQANDDRKLFVGNLAWAVDGLDLEDIFKEFGVVESAQVINDRETGRSRGFGFVIMATKEESAAAASELSGANIDGRKIIVEFASEKAKEER